MKQGQRLPCSPSALDWLTVCWPRKTRRRGLSTTRGRCRFAKPLDHDLIRQLARHHEIVVTVEEGAIGGFGSQVSTSSPMTACSTTALKIRSLVLTRPWMDQAKPEVMYAKAGLDRAGIVKTVVDALGRGLQWAVRGETKRSAPDRKQPQAIARR